jgi:FKBP-type peptidyl-prolyl cis-trans isomerase (trigger factor)
LKGLKQLLARDYDINNKLSQLKESIRRQGQERQIQRIEEERAKAAEKGPVKLKKSVVLPSSLTTASQLDELIRQLQELKQQMALGVEVELNFVIQD